MALKLKYQGQQQSRSRTESTFKETYYGSESEIDDKISTIEIGAKIEGKGYLNSWRKTQMDGQFYQIEIQYRTSTETSGSGDANETIVGSKSATLSSRTIQMPLQKHPDYRTNWNYILIAEQGKSVPSWWETSTDLQVEQGYKWIKNISEKPADADGKKWKVLKEKEMQAQVYDYSHYVITILSRYRTANAAGRAVSKKLNKIVSPDQDFGLSGGDFKLDDVSVSYDGEYWIATETYTMSGDSDGWDKRLYS